MYWFCLTILKYGYKLTLSKKEEFAFGFVLNRGSKIAKSLSGALLVVGAFFDEFLIKSDGNQYLPPGN